VLIKIAVAVSIAGWYVSDAKKLTGGLSGPLDEVKHRRGRRALARRARPRAGAGHGRPSRRGLPARRGAVVFGAAAGSVAGAFIGENVLVDEGFNLSRDYANSAFKSVQGVRHR
jgi:anti-sigma factor RsiW